MSHEAHHTGPNIKPQAAGKSSLWVVIILVGLFIAAVNFVNVMGHDTEQGHGATDHATEKHTTQDATHIEGTPQDNIAADPAKKPSEVDSLPHVENAPLKAPSEVEGH